MGLKRLDLFPVSTVIQMAVGGETSLSIAGSSLAALAEEHGTPLYLYDQATLDGSLDAYLSSLAAAYPGPAGITYAGKAFLCVAMAQWAASQGLLLDCTGAGEIQLAAAAGVRREQIIAHGVNKSRPDLSAAAVLAGTIVVDHLSELSSLAETFARAQKPLPELWLRLRPGLAVNTHVYTQTGQDDSKFGMNAEEIRQAVCFCQEHGLPLTGLHFHQGSLFHDLAPLGSALETAMDLIAELQKKQGWLAQKLSPGGGWGVAYHEDELPHPPIRDYVGFIAGSIRAGCQARGLPLPHLQLEPGRSLAARAGVALYRVGAVKSTANRRWLLIDGGLADNPRPALYGTRYSALPVVNPERPTAGPAWLGGPYCESGDVLIAALPLPDIQTGELIAVPVSGAYQISMSSNYNGACKPAVLWLKEGQAHLIRRRETSGDLFRNDLPLTSL